MKGMEMCIQWDREDLGMAYKYARRNGCTEFELSRMRRVLRSLRLTQIYFRRMEQ